MPHENKRRPRRGESGKGPNKSAWMVSLFMATTLAGCSPAARPQIPATNNQPVQQSVNVPPYGGTARDYCTDLNRDGRCDDDNSAYDGGYSYYSGGQTYYGRQSFVGSGGIGRDAAAYSNGTGAASGSVATDTHGTSSVPGTSARSGSFSSGSSSGGASSGISSGVSGAHGGIGSSGGASSG